jgi:hypothetical protein
VALPALLTMLFSWLPPFRALLVWVHERTQSLPVVLLLHAAVSFVTLTVRPQGLTGTRLLYSGRATACVSKTCWAALFVIVGATSSRVPSGEPDCPQLWRDPLHADFFQEHALRRVFSNSPNSENSLPFRLKAIHTLQTEDR